MTGQDGRGALCAHRRRREPGGSPSVVRRVVAGAVVALALAAAGCGARAAGAGTDDPDRRARDRELTVFAAASLTEAMETVADRFEQAHPGTTVRLQLAGSQTLATQLAEGAAADLFVSADERQMDVVVDRVGLAHGPVVVARNRLALAVPADNPGGIRSVDDLARADVAVVLAAPEVPAGRYALATLTRAGVSVRPVSVEADVRGVLTRLSLGEADAGVVYTSDVMAAGGRVARVRAPILDEVAVTYPGAVPASATDPDGGRDLLTFLQGPRGRTALLDAGLRAP